MRPVNVIDIVESIGRMKKDLANIFIKFLLIEIFITMVFFVCFSSLAAAPLTATPIMLCQSLMPQPKFKAPRHSRDRFVSISSSKEVWQFFIKHVAVW